MRPKLVIFDCDGVLVDSEVATNTFLAANLTTHGLSITVGDCMEAFVGSTMQGVMDKARGMGADLPDTWVEDFDSVLFEHLKKGVPLIRGVLSTIAALEDEDVPFCVASNGSEEKMRITLGQNGLWDKLSGRVFSAATVGISKPDPGLFLHAADQFNVAADKCVVVEDSRSGVTAAVAAGMRCIGYVPEGSEDKLSDLGAEVIHDIAEIPALIGL